MRAELRHLLDKLKATKEGFREVIIHENGSARAVFRWGTLSFSGLEELERWTYAPTPPRQADEEETRTTGYSHVQEEPTLL